MASLSEPYDQLIEEEKSRRCSLADGSEHSAGSAQKWIAPFHDRPKDSGEGNPAHLRPSGHPSDDRRSGWGRANM